MHRLYVFFFVTFSALGQEPALQLQLRTVADQKQFHIGQPIPVTLTFETASAQSFIFNLVGEEKEHI
jgi:hypothetical protein